MSEYQIKNIVVVYMEEFYCLFFEVKVIGEKFDGLIIIGVLIEYLLFEEVIYWDEFCEVFDWIQIYVYLILGVCWGGMVMIYYFYGVKKYILDVKVFGCFW